MPIVEQLYDDNDVYRSWADYNFKFIEPSQRTQEKGLRKPQISALYTILGHLTSTPAVPALVVMPTGTGKSDTIFSLIISGRFPKTLIIVPSDALREQVSENIQTLKNLRDMGAISQETLSPKVLKVSSKLDDEGLELAKLSNVIISTPQALQRLTEEELSSFTDLCSHLIIDEAHHVAARTWNRIKKCFKNKPCIQFTATPFREDKEGLDGKIIYNYPLKEAQSDGYFQEIEFHPIREYQPSLADNAIAEKAVALLKADLADNKDHLMLVRAKSQKRADELFEIYKSQKELNPILIHSKTKNRATILKSIKAKEHRIIVCVDMLGEGFDLPELKIAAIHDQHCSPAVTLQFIGRMTRANKKLGTAKFVANIANQRMDAQMSALYEESADWSTIIRDVSAKKIKREIQREALESKFKKEESGEKILALNPTPNISATAYTISKDDWLPNNAQYFSSHSEEMQLVSVSDAGDMVVMVTKSEASVPWANTSEVKNTEWFLYAAYYLENEKTLFIHCSGDDGQTSRFRDLIAKNPTKIFGERTFRILHNIDFLRLQNVGLSRASKDIRFTMHVGRDINAIISDLETGAAVKSNIFAVGYEDGKKSTAGCSYKGKIWEMNSESLDYWAQWCESAAAKLNDPNIDTKLIIENSMRAEQIKDSWPTGIFFADWPDELSIEREIKTHLTISGISYNLLDVFLGQPNKASSRVLEIPILTHENGIRDEELSNIQIELLDDGFRTKCNGIKLSGSKDRDFAEYLDNNPLRLLKQDGSFIRGNYRYFSPQTLNVKIPREHLIVWDWGDTRIEKESMGKNAELDCVQGFTFKKIEDTYQIVFNDDDAGEIADLIGINEKDGVIFVDFYHCKYCPSKQGVAKAGGRVEDTYVVSGQTSRSVKWLHQGEQLFSQIIARYQRSIDKGFDRVLKGKISDIDILKRKCRDLELVMGFFIVQPAISEKALTDEQLTVLGTSYTYIKGISGKNLKVIINQ